MALDLKTKKFGANPAVGASYVPVCLGGIYRTPQVSGVQTLRIKAGNANDTVAGDGARKVILQGLDETGAFAEEEIETNGISAGAASTTTFLRLWRAYVSESGTYATVTPLAGSHAADVVVEDTGGNAWATLTSTGYPTSQTIIGALSVPLGKMARIKDLIATVDSGKTATIAVFNRANILDTSAPYQAMRLQAEFDGVSGSMPLRPTKYDDGDDEYFWECDELTDFLVMAKVDSTSASVSVVFGVEYYNRLSFGVNR